MDNLRLQDEPQFTQTMVCCTCLRILFTWEHGFGLVLAFHSIRKTGNQVFIDLRTQYQDGKHLSKHGIDLTSTK